MNDTQPQSAMRDLQDLRDHMFKPQVVAILVLLWVLVTIAGPFDTLSMMGPGERAVYWGVVVFTTYTAGATVTVLAGTRICRRLRPLLLALVLAAGVVALGVFAVLLVVNGLMLGSWLSGPVDAAINLLFVYLISLTVVAGRQFTVGEVGIPKPEAPMILDRLPLDKRGALISLSVQDHYVEIVTDRGREMVLMRLSDAMREVAPVEGLQVHRSYWVARDAIRSVERTADAARIHLSPGAEVPVSRGFLPEVRAAGLLPSGRGGTGARQSELRR